ncbi:MAG: NAD-dependent epimerase/dehydratase family protein [Parvibaculaceae bacterium]
MKIAIAGASGVIGRRVVLQLIDAGHRVTALTRPGSRRRASLPPGCRVAEASLFDRAEVTAAIAGHDVAINLATHIPRSPLAMMFRRAWHENDRIRTEGALNIALAAAKSDVKILVQESFAFAYPSSGADWIDERTPLQPAAYCRSVLSAEAAAMGFARSDARAVILRFAPLYGPDASQTGDMVRAVRKGWAVLPGKRTSFISSLSHDDAASAVVAAIGAATGAYNVSDDCPVTHEEFMSVIADALEVPEPRFLPAWTAALMGSAGRTLARSIRLRNDRLKSATAWTPRFSSVREGLPGAAIAAGDNPAA